MRKWNVLPQKAKQTGALASVKLYLNRAKKKVPQYHFTGNRKLFYTRVRKKLLSYNTFLNILHPIRRGAAKVYVAGHRLP